MMPDQERFKLPREDPFTALDRETDRLYAFFSTLSPEDWTRPTRCEGWDRRVMAAHLDGDEEYNIACLQGDLGPFLGEFADLDTFNTTQIRKRAHLSAQETLEQWRKRQKWVRSEWERLGLKALIPTSVGPYPLHAQIWHITSEYATHADDMAVEIPKNERVDRLGWRVQFSLFAVQGKSHPPDLARKEDSIAVGLEGKELKVSVDEFVAAVSARLPLPDDPFGRKIIESLRALA